MWGIIPAAGGGTRIQPLAFSKELLPVGSRVENGEERPKAVSEYLVERLIEGGAYRLCFVISPGKSDILRYYGTGPAEAPARRLCRQSRCRSHPGIGECGNQRVIGKFGCTEQWLLWRAFRFDVDPIGCEQIELLPRHLGHTRCSGGSCSR